MMKIPERFSPGVTLIELMIVMVLGAILLTAGYQVQRYFASSAQREKLKAELQRDLLTYAEMIEKDVRMAGLGLPGNGIDCVLSSTGSDELTIYSNPQRIQTTLAADVPATGTSILIADAAGMESNGWVCIEQGGTFYRQIDRVGSCSGTPDTIHLTTQIGVAVGAAGARALPATRVRYWASKSTARGLHRMRNSVDTRVSERIDSLDIAPQDAAGNPVGAPYATVEVMTVGISGEIGIGTNKTVVAESIEANVRNPL